MILPPLPLIDGAFLIDNSTLEKLKCPQLWYLEALRKRTLASSKAGRNFGSGLHIGWARRYRECLERPVTPEVTTLINDDMAKWFEEHPQPFDDFRTHAHACTVMAAYNAHYGLEPFKIITNPSTGKPIVEASFALPLGKVHDTPIIWCGKIDLGTEDNNGIWAGPDHKTTFQFGETFDMQMARDGGQLGYTWALWQVLGKRPRGYIIDAVRIRRASKRSEYNDLPPVDASDFKRIPYDVTEENLTEWREDVLDSIEFLFHLYDTQHFPHWRWHCTNKYGRCDMYDVCSVAKGARESVLMSTLFEDNTWSPLNLPSA